MRVLLPANRRVQEPWKQQLWLSGKPRQEVRSYRTEARCSNRQVPRMLERTEGLFLWLAGNNLAPCSNPAASRCSDNIGRVNKHHAPQDRRDEEASAAAMLPPLSAYPNLVSDRQS